MSVCVFGVVCMYANSTASGAEGPRGLVVRYTLRFNSFRVVVIHHLVWDFSQNALSQGSRGGLEIQTERQRWVSSISLLESERLTLLKVQITVDDQTSSSDSHKNIHPFLIVWFSGVITGFLNTVCVQRSGTAENYITSSQLLSYCA